MPAHISMAIESVCFLFHIWTSAWKAILHGQDRVGEDETGSTLIRTIDLYEVMFYSLLNQLILFPKFFLLKD